MGSMRGVAEINGKRQEAIFYKARTTRQTNFISLKQGAPSILLDFKLTGSEFRLLLALLELYSPPADKGFIYYPSVANLADRLGTSSQFVFRHLSNLRDRQIISIDKSDVGGSKIIRFADWLVY